MVLKSKKKLIIFGTGGAAKLAYEKISAKNDIEIQGFLEFKKYYKNNTFLVKNVYKFENINKNFVKKPLLPSDLYKLLCSTTTSFPGFLFSNHASIDKEVNGQIFTTVKILFFLKDKNNLNNPLKIEKRLFLWFIFSILISLLIPSRISPSYSKT